VNRLVRADVHGGVATLTLSSAHNRNALSSQLRTELHEELQNVFERPDVRSVVLTHDGPVFCSGMDLKEVNTPADTSAAVSLPTLLEAMWAAPKPLLASLRGPARAGGIGLMAACDIAIASDEATFSFREVRIGVVPEIISVTVLPRTVRHLVHEAFLTGETFDASRAVAMGLLNSSVPLQRLDAEVRRYTDMFSLAAPGALAGTKRLLRETSTSSIHDDLVKRHSKSLEYFGSDEGREGIAAFQEKRHPSWAVTSDSSRDAS
jgi:methylglutaconyl-CoA hydratase